MSAENHAHFSTGTAVPSGHAAILSDPQASNHLRQIVERLERQIDENAEGLRSVKDIYSEAKGVGYDVEIIKKCLKLRKADRQKIAEEDELVQLYMLQLG